MRVGRKDKRKAIIAELARQALLDRLQTPQPITKAEKNDYYMQLDFKAMVKEISDALYHSPGQIIKQKSYDRSPEKSIKQLLIELEERLRNKIQTVV